jgi:hypothetical protein
MTKKPIIITWIFICVNSISIGQDSTILKSRHLIGIYTGYSKHIIKDDIISALKYKGSTAPIGLKYSFQKAKYIQDLTLYYDKTILKSSILNSQFSPYTNNLSAIIGYTYNRKIYSNSKINTDFYLGGKFIWEINYREHFYNSYFNEISGEQITSIGLNLIILKNFLSSDDDLYFEFNIPILAYSVFNNRYNTVVGDATENVDEAKNIYWQLIQNGQIITLNNFQEFQSTVCYSKFLLNNFGLLFKYQLRFYNLVQYKDTFYVRHLNNQFNIGFIFKIEK